MRRIQLDPNELQEWMRDSWQQYASETIRLNKSTKQLSLWVNHLIEYRVKYGPEILYEGSQMTHAIAAWESV